MRSIGLALPVLWQCAPVSTAPPIEHHASAFEVAFDARGVTLRGLGRATQLSLRCVGRAERCDAPSASSARTIGNRVEYARGPVREWYVTSPAGVEQGFTLAERPEGDGGLVVRIDVAGLRSAPLDEGALGLFDGARAAYRVDRMYAFDANHRSLRAWMSAEPEGIALHVDDRDATYPITIDPMYGADATKVVSPGIEAGQQFGASVAISGDLAMVGNPYGSAFSFARTGATWTAQSWLFPDDAALGDDFGSEVALSGETALIAASLVDVAGKTDAGAAYVYVRSGGMKFYPQAKLFASDPLADAYFGRHVAIDGDTAVVVSLPKSTTNENGAAYVFTRTGTTWTQQQKLAPADLEANGAFGSSVSIHKDTIVVGARYASGGAGALHVFVRSGAVWTRQQVLTTGESVGWFGWSASIDGDTLLVSAPSAFIAGALRSGAAYVFTRAAGTWTLEQRLEPSDPTDGHRFGTTTALRGNTAVVGTYTVGSFAGAAYVYSRVGTTWTEQAKVVAKDSAADSYYTCSIGLSGDKLVVGSYGATVDGKKLAGAAYFYRLAPTLAAAAKCAADADCTSKHCALPEGVCCDRACSGPCESCVAAEKVSGVDGVCGPIKANTDPRDKCAPAMGTCAADGLCDGAGSCRSFAGAGTSCGAKSCTDGVASAMVCKGDTADCVPRATKCEAYVCDADTCKTGCATNADCAAKFRCNAGVCEPGEARCSDDGSKTINNTSGLETACAPFRCDPAKGACLGACLSEAECLAGYRCTSAGLCAELPPPPPDDPGCAFGARRGSAFAALAIVALLGARRRRR